MKNNLEPCTYCKDQPPPKSKAKRKRLLDTRQNRARELSLWRYLGKEKKHV